MPRRHDRSRHARPGRLVHRRRSLVIAGSLMAGAALVVWFAAAGPGRGTPEAGSAGGSRSAGPTASSASSPATATTSTPDHRGTLVIHGAGDVNVDPGYIPNLRTRGYAWAWTGLRGLFGRDDLTVVNLECAVSDLGTAVPKVFNFRGDPAALPAMKAAGVDVASMANNHSYDYGPAALMDTRRNLVKNRITPVGAGSDPAQALAPALFDVEGWRIAVLGFDQVVDPWPEAVAAPGHPGTAGGHDVDAMVAAIRAAAGQADLVVVMIHWGVELDTRPRPDQVAEARRFIDAGADVIFGGHSHRLQPLAWYRGRPIFYSLGNFVWPALSVAGSTTAVAEVTVTPSGRFRAKTLPAYIEESGHPVLR